MQKRVKEILVIAFSVYTIISFMCFICEEAMQTAMFASFAFSEAEDWYGLQSHIVLMKSIHKTSEFMINSCGWIAFISYPAYRTYLRANEGYIKAAESRLERGLSEWQ